MIIDAYLCGQLIRNTSAVTKIVPVTLKVSFGCLFIDPILLSSEELLCWYDSMLKQYYDHAS
jgi:hypothetical protein